MKKTDQLAALS